MVWPGWTRRFRSGVALPRLYFTRALRRRRRLIRHDQRALGRSTVQDPGRPTRGVAPRRRYVPTEPCRYFRGGKGAQTGELKLPGAFAIRGGFPTNSKQGRMRIALEADHTGFMPETLRATV